MEQIPPGNGTAADRTVHKKIWLLGQPLLRHYLDFVTEDTVDGATADLAALANEWRAANDYYHELELHEAGIADKVECQELPPTCAPLAAAVAANSGYRRSFDLMPTSFGLVELDRLVVSQRSVTADFIEGLAVRLRPAPDLETLFRFCFPLEPPDAPVHIRRVGTRRYVFRSDSSDFRFHEPVLLQPDQIHEYDAFGPVAGIVGLVIGFGSNFLNAIRVGNRLLLNNGYHRACALRTLGITHAPCIIQTISRLDELDLIAKRKVAEDPDFYFNTARPPLLKDFFDPKIRKIWLIYKQIRMVEVTFEVRDYALAE
jgi:hypothetical protein